LTATGATYAATGVTQTPTAEPAIVQKDVIHHRGPQGRRHRRLAARLARQLDLTDAQKEQIKAIHEAEKPTIEPLVKQIRAVTRELRTVTSNGQFNETQVRALANQKAQTLAELIVARERVQSKVFAVLTPEQQSKLNQMRERAKERFLNRMAN
jgi:protein CpxP